MADCPDISVALASLPGLGAPGFGVEVPGSGQAGTAAGLDVVGPGDAQPVAGAAAGIELPGLEPVVDDAGAAAQPAGGLGDAEFAGCVGAGCRDLVSVADPLDGSDVEGFAVACGQPGGVEALGQVAGVGGRAEPADHFHCRGRASPGGPGRQRPVRDEFVDGAGVPADPDPYFAPVGLRQHRDIGDQGAQQPLAVLGAGGGGV